MTDEPTSLPEPLFDLRNATLTLNALVLRTTDAEQLSRALDQRFGATPALFDHDPVIVDLSALAGTDEAIDFARLIAVLRGHRMLLAGVEGGSEAQHAAARAVGLGEAATYTASPRTEPGGTVEAPPRPPPAPAPTPAAVPVAAPGTVVIDRPLRSGQQVYARGADLVVLSAVNFGAEVIADGHIHVYAPLRGRAIAGARGNTSARIFSLGMEPQLVAIAGVYRTLETPLPADVHGHAAQVRLDDDALVFEALAS